MTSEMEEINRLLKLHGTFRRQAKHGELWDLPMSQTIQVSLSPGDPRKEKNILAELRRKLRLGEITLEEPMAKETPRIFRSKKVIEEHELLIESLTDLLEIPREAKEVVFKDCEGRVIDFPITVTFQVKKETS